jgi:hypothetical protein
MASISPEELSEFNIFNEVPLEKLKLLRDLIRIEHVDQGAMIIEDGTTGSTL